MNYTLGFSASWKDNVLEVRYGQSVAPLVAHQQSQRSGHFLKRFLQEFKNAQNNLAINQLPEFRAPEPGLAGTGRTADLDTAFGPRGRCRDRRETVMLDRSSLICKTVRWGGWQTLWLPTRTMFAACLASNFSPAPELPAANAPGTIR